jgi:outer membrane murein-binding lipoprotein Lpp
MTAPIDTSPEAVAWMLDGVTMPDDEPRQIVSTGEEGSDVWQPGFGTWEADDFGMDSDEPVGSGERLFVNRRIYDALAARVAELEAERDRMLTQVTALSADADAARKAAAKNFDRAEAQSRLVADLNRDCTKLMADLHHETGLREDAEAKVARLTESVNYLIEDMISHNIDDYASVTIARAALDGEAPPTEYEVKLAQLKRDFPNGI